jgi:hypothetical protein
MLGYLLSGPCVADVTGLLPLYLGIHSRKKGKRTVELQKLGIVRLLRAVPETDVTILDLIYKNITAHIAFTRGELLDGF